MMRFLVLLLASAAGAMAQNFAFQVGSPVASQDFHFKTAAFVFRTVGCSGANVPKISATAEGVVKNQRQSIALKVVEGNKPGVYAVFQNWPRGGEWLVDLAGSCGNESAGALIPVGPNGFNRQSAKFFSHTATTSEIEASLRELAQGRNSGLIIHEWGTFTSVAAKDGSAELWSVLGDKDDLPGFVHDRGYRGFKVCLEGTVRMETPVLYFYSPRELSAHVRVSFPKGLITEWYPKAEYQVDQKTATGAAYRLPQNLNGIDMSMMSLTGGVEWKSITVEPGAMVDLPRESTRSRYYAARATDSSLLDVDGEHEKFLFYRGVGRFSVPLSARLSEDGKVVLANCGAEMPVAILFENRGGRLGYRITRTVVGDVTLDRPALGGNLEGLTADLENVLVEQGLFRKEAQAMVATWRDSWFEEGARVIYIVPTTTVNGVLPLQIDPLPEQITRVFVGRMELITPEISQAVEAAIATNDWCVGERYGRFLDPILRRIVLENPARAHEVQHFQANAAATRAVVCGLGGN